MWAARSRGVDIHGWILVGCALTAAVPYLFLIDFAVPRFLLPSYAFLALLIAFGLLWIVDRRAWKMSAFAAALVTVLLAGHFVLQQVAFTRADSLVRSVGNSHVAQTNFLRDEVGITGPCLVVGSGAVQQGFLLGCHSSPANEETLTAVKPRIDEALRQGEKVVVRMRVGNEVPDYMADWTMIDLPSTHIAYVAYLPPR